MNWVNSKLSLPEANDMSTLSDSSRRMLKKHSFSTTKEYKCRFCQELGNYKDPLFNPCKCKGQLIYTHKTCLKNWITSKKHNKCELCKHPYDKRFFQNSSPTFLYKKKLKLFRIISVLFVLLCLLLVPLCIYSSFSIQNYNTNTKGKEKILFTLFYFLLSFIVVLTCFCFIYKRLDNVKSTLWFNLTRSFPNEKRIYLSDDYYMDIGKSIN